MRCDAAGLVMEALTNRDVGGDPAREREILCTLLRTDDGKRYMHEGFSADDPAKSVSPSQAPRSPVGVSKLSFTAASFRADVLSFFRCSLVRIGVTTDHRVCCSHAGITATCSAGPTRSLPRGF